MALAGVPKGRELVRICDPGSEVRKAQQPSRVPAHLPNAGSGVTSSLEFPLRSHSPDKTAQTADLLTARPCHAIWRLLLCRSEECTSWTGSRVGPLLGPWTPPQSLPRVYLTVYSIFLKFFIVYSFIYSSK